MTRLQFTETTLQRLQPRLDALGGDFEYVVMDRAGVLRFEGREVRPEQALPECGMLSNDLFFAPFCMNFVDTLVQSPALKWVQSCGAGLDHPMFVKLAERRDIRLTTNHSQGLAISEYVMWGVLDHFQTRAAQAARATDTAVQLWLPRRAREIYGSRWLIVGFGSIGENVARRAKAFGAHVTGVRRTPKPASYADAVIGPEAMFEALREADVVVLCMPRTPETLNLVDTAFLAAMKPTALLINVGRGSAIDDKALIEALAAGRPEHALLDVFRCEPLPDNHPFWSHPRITVTAHTSAVSSGWEQRLDDLVMDNISRYVAGEPLLNEVPISAVPRAPFLS